MEKTPLLVFDVNETLLDLSPAKTRVNDLVGNAHAFKGWFSLLLHYSCVETITDNPIAFGAIGKATLKWFFRNTGRK